MAPRFAERAVPGAVPGPLGPGTAASLSRSVRGFSLVELMVAMAIFSVLGVALIALLRSSTAFLEKGQSGSELHDQLENAQRVLQDDFSNVYIQPATREGMPDVRFLCDRIPFDTTGDGVPDVQAPRLCFVRSVKGEASDPVLRGSGAKAGAMGVLDGEEDAREAEGGDLRAPGGKQEVCYLLVPAAKDEEPGVGTLYRGVRMPLGGGAASLLPAEPLSDRRASDARIGVVTRADAKTKLRPVVTSVLYASFGFHTRHTKESAARLVDGDRLVDEVPPLRGGGGLSPTWDSTRGLLPLGQGPDQFFLGRNPASLSDSIDDVFPKRVRVILVVDRVGNEAATGDLVRDLGPQDKNIPVDSTRFAPGGDPVSRFVKIDDEWIQWSTRDGRSFTVEKRGARGTRPASHTVGSSVRAGATLVREFEIPSFREDWNE